MARKGILPKGVKLEPLMADKKTPRCQFVRRVGVQCGKASMHGRERCRSHGGKSGRPPIHGKYSKFNPVPRRLQARFEKAATDPELLDLTKDIALVDAQVWEMAESAQSQDTFTPIQTRKLLLLLKHKRALTKQETERRIAMGSMLDVQQVMVLIGYVYDSITKHVTDEKERRAIGNDLRSLVGDAIMPAVVKSKALVKA